MKIFITGVSCGLGLALAKDFIHNGDFVWGIGRRQFTLKGVKDKSFRYSQCNTAKKDEVETVFNEMVADGFIPDIAIFCAGSVTDDIDNNNGKFVSCKFKENFDVNLFGLLYWVELLIPLFLDKNSGVFAVISSMSIYAENHGKRIGYSASRIALNKAFENFRQEYFGTEIKFKVFTMGRLKETEDFIGTSYKKASKSIVTRLKCKRNSNTFNIPYIQYLLTRIASFVPKKLFIKYLLK